MLEGRREPLSSRPPGHGGQGAWGALFVPHSVPHTPAAKQSSRNLLPSAPKHLQPLACSIDFLEGAKGTSFFFLFFFFFFFTYPLSLGTMVSKRR
jgi:hypothetical protein